MPDVYVNVTEAAPEVLEGLMTALELRAADPQLCEMLDRYLTDAALPEGTRVLEVGCGTGAVIRRIATLPAVASAVGVDPSPVFVERATGLAHDIPSLSFETADGRSLPFPDASFDAVVFHTTLCHVPNPSAMLAEAVRVLEDGGCVAIFEGDYAGASLATRTEDPLEMCADSFREHFIRDPWLARTLVQVVGAAGLQVRSVRSYSYTETIEAGFMLRSWVDMGAEALAASGKADAEEVARLKAEARRRVEAGEYFAHIPYVSLIGRKVG